MRFPVSICSTTQLVSITKCKDCMYDYILCLLNQMPLVNRCSVLEGSLHFMEYWNGINGLALTLLLP